jgi:hypothetical protein
MTALPEAKSKSSTPSHSPEVSKVGLAKSTDHIGNNSTRQHAYI